MVDAVISIVLERHIFNNKNQNLEGSSELWEPNPSVCPSPPLSSPPCMHAVPGAPPHAFYNVAAFADFVLDFFFFFFMFHTFGDFSASFCHAWVRKQGL